LFSALGPYSHIVICNTTTDGQQGQMSHFFFHGILHVQSLQNIIS
jgi:hypothetical protein